MVLMVGSHYREGRWWWGQASLHKLDVFHNSAPRLQSVWSSASRFQSCNQRVVGGSFVFASCLCSFFKICLKILLSKFSLLFFQSSLIIKMVKNNTLKTNWPTYESVHTQAVQPNILQTLRSSQIFQGYQIFQVEFGANVFKIIVSQIHRFDIRK